MFKIKENNALIEISLIIADQNYRHEFEYAFSEASLSELCESIKQTGLLQPITLRPYPKKEGFYQLIAGERRLRASKMAGATHIKAIISDYSDEQAQLVQLTENLQRVDVHPLSEEAVYEKMLLSGMKPLQIASRVGKNEKFVVTRLSLVELTTYWKKLFFEGGILLNGALLISRLPKDVQVKLALKFPREKMVVNGRIEKPIAASILRDVIKQQFFLDLSQAAFPKDDKDLLPEAGDCHSCTKHTGYNKLLFSEISQEDYCLNAECFHAKVSRFKEKQKKMLDHHKVCYREISTGLHTDTPGVLAKYEYETLDKSAAGRPGVVKALVVEGNTDVGKMVYIRMKSSMSGPDPLELAEAAEKRKLTLQKQKIEKEKRRLIHQKVLDNFARGGQGSETYARLLDYLILSRLGERPTKELTDHLSARYSWQVKVDTSDYENREKQLQINVSSTPVERKLELFVDLFLSQMAFNENSRELQGVATLLGIDVEQLGQMAGDQGAAHKEERVEAIPIERALVA